MTILKKMQVAIGVDTMTPSLRQQIFFSRNSCFQIKVADIC